MTLDYRPDARPKDRKELSEHVKKYLRSMRALYKKAGKALKYVWVAEIGSKGAIHIHIVINGIEDIKAVVKLWEHGGTTFKMMYEDGNYRKLAAYFIKYSEKTLKTTGELQGKRWNASKNLITPPEKKTAGYKNFIFTTIMSTPFSDANIDKKLKSIVEAYNRLEHKKAAEQNADRTYKHNKSYIETYSVHKVGRKNINIKALQKFMGHTDIKTTMNIYNHLNKAVVKEEIKKIEKQIKVI